MRSAKMYKLNVIDRSLVLNLEGRDIKLLVILIDIGRNSAPPELVNGL